MCNQVNSFYLVTHVDHYRSLTDPGSYIVYDAGSGEYTFSDAFLEHLGHWETLLADTIDPLVDEGYLIWASPAEVGEMYLDWEAACEE